MGFAEVLVGLVPTVFHVVDLDPVSVATRNRKGKKSINTVCGSTEVALIVREVGRGRRRYLGERRRFRNLDARQSLQVLKKGSGITAIWPKHFCRQVCAQAAASSSQQHEDALLSAQCLAA